MEQQKRYIQPVTNDLIHIIKMYLKSMETLSFVFSPTFLISYLPIFLFSWSGQRIHFAGEEKATIDDLAGILFRSSSEKCGFHGRTDEMTCLDEGFPQQNDRFGTLPLPGDT